MKNVNSAVFLFLSLFAVSGLSADWQLIEDWRICDRSDWELKFFGDESALALPRAEIVDDPFAHGQGEVLSVKPGVAGEVSLLGYTEVPIKKESQIVYSDNGAKSTLHFKIGLPLVGGNPAEVEVSIGLADKGDPGIDTLWSGISAYVRIQSNGVLSVRDEASGFKQVTNGPLNTGVYYSIWFVLDHGNQTFSLYIQGGDDYPTQTRLYSDAAYRKETFEPLERIVIITTAGNSIDGVRGRDPIYIDDIYVDPYAENIAVHGSVGAGVFDVSSIQEVESNLVNISTRGVVGEGNSSLIGGFVIEGDKPMSVLIQGVGEELVGVGGLTEDDVLKDGFLTLRGGSEELSNDDWETVENVDLTAIMTLNGSFELQPGSKSSALYVELEPGVYTARLSGVDGAEGVALIEVYEVSRESICD
tara:strand:- start:9 stop:1259 length:1251 start_codon:yes stop_codon:yes gene_type:complete